MDVRKHSLGVSLGAGDMRSVLLPGSQSDSPVSKSALQRKDANLKRKDCCDFGSGAENGKEELKNMN